MKTVGSRSGGTGESASDGDGRLAGLAHLSGRLRLPSAVPKVLSMAIVASVFTVRLALPGGVLAATTTNCSDGPGAVNYWRGEALTAGQKHGTSGTVPAYTMVLCTSPNPILEIDGSFYFSNVEPASGTFRDIIQIGFGQGRSPTLYDGMRFEVGYGRSTSTYGCAGYSNRDPMILNLQAYDNAQHDYKVYHQTNYWRLFVDSTQKYSVAESEICWTPGKSEWFGETWDKGDQMGGTSSNHLKIESMNYANAENGGFYWTSFNPSQACNSSASGPSAYQCDIVSATRVDVWTNNR